MLLKASAEVTIRQQKHLTEAAKIMESRQRIAAVCVNIHWYDYTMSAKFQSQVEKDYSKTPCFF